MRKSVESLCGIVRTSHMNPLNGDAHVFSQQITLLTEKVSRISSGRMTFNSVSYGSQVFSALKFRQDNREVIMTSPISFFIHLLQPLPPLKLSYRTI